MIWFILAIIVAIGAGLCSAMLYESTEDGLSSFGCWLFIGALLAIFMNGACAYDETEGVIVESIYETRKISALNDATAVSGSFFLGSGRVGEEMRYYFVVETEDGKMLDSISAENVLIIESDEETPRIETWTKQWTNEAEARWLTIFPPSGGGYRIYVPKGSVTTNFSVDLGNGTLTPGATTNNPTSPPHNQSLRPLQPYPIRHRQLLPLLWHPRNPAHNLLLQLRPRSERGRKLLPQLRRPNVRTWPQPQPQPGLKIPLKQPTSIQAPGPRYPTFSPLIFINN